MRASQVIVLERDGHWAAALAMSLVILDRIAIVPILRLQVTTRPA